MQSGGELRDNPLLNNDCNFVHVQQLVCVTGGHCGPATGAHMCISGALSLCVYTYIRIGTDAAKSIYVCGQWVYLHTWPGPRAHCGGGVGGWRVDPLPLNSPPLFLAQCTPALLLLYSQQIISTPLQKRKRFDHHLFLDGRVQQRERKGCAWRHSLS
jgi:hypothetical protein